jgi:hypothetical protein
MCNEEVESTETELSAVASSGKGNDINGIVAGSNGNKYLV